jgi:hypothetical protein
MRVKEDVPGSFFGRRSRVLDVVGGDPMAMPPARRVSDVDEEDREEDNVPFIWRGIQCRCGIVTRGWLPAAMWSRTKVRVRPRTPHQTFRIAAFLFAGALVVRQLHEAAPREERRPVVIVAGTLEGIVALLRREHLIVVPVDGGLLRCAVGHRVVGVERMAGINVGPCSEATSRCGWAKLPPMQ